MPHARTPSSRFSAMAAILLGAVWAMTPMRAFSQEEPENPPPRLEQDQLPVGELAAPVKGGAPERPVTGAAVAAFAPLDKAILEFMDRIHCQAGTAAVSFRGDLLFSRGYGWRDEEKKEPTPPDALMRIASVTKPITAAAVKQLMREDKLTSATKAFEFLALEPPAGATPDPRLKDITARHLLRHQGGWDAKQSFDPMFQSERVEKALGLDHRARPLDVVRFMLGQPLQFAPGERSQYSNFGFVVLGRVIEKASGKAYGDYIREDLLKPQGIVDILPGRDDPKDRDPREVWYPAPRLRVEVMDANGGLIASAPALCRFLDRFWISGDPRRPGQRAQYVFFGSINGTTAMARQRPDGYNVATLFNARRNAYVGPDNKQLRETVDKAIDEAIQAQPSPGLGP